MSIETKIQELQSRLQTVNQKVSELENIASKTEGKLSDSFITRVDDLKKQRSLLTDHISSLELDLAQSWQTSDFGSDMVGIAKKLIDRIDKLLSRSLGYEHKNFD
jgi:predicted nuclease with TOPRIM domain